MRSVLKASSEGLFSEDIDSSIRFMQTKAVGDPRKISNKASPAILQQSPSQTHRGCECMAFQKARNGNYQREKKDLEEAEKSQRARGETVENKRQANLQEI